MLFSTCHLEGGFFDTFLIVSTLSLEGCEKGINRINGRSQKIETIMYQLLIMRLQTDLVCYYKINSNVIRVGIYLELHF